MDRANVSGEGAVGRVEDAATSAGVPEVEVVTARTDGAGRNVGGGDVPSPSTNQIQAPRRKFVPAPPPYPPPAAILAELKAANGGKKTGDDMERDAAIMSMVSLNSPPQTLNAKYLNQLSRHIRVEAKSEKAAGTVSIWDMKMDPRHPSLGIYPYLNLLLISFVALTEIIDQDLALLEVCARGKDDQKTTSAAKSLQSHLKLSSTLSPIFKENFDLYQKLFDQFDIDLDKCCGCSCAFLTWCWLPAITGRIKTLDYYQSMVRWSLVCCEQYSVYSKALLSLSPALTSDEVVVLFESKVFKSMGESRPALAK